MPKHANQTSFKYDPSKHIQFTCVNCHKPFSRLLSDVQKRIARGRKRAYCSQACWVQHRVGHNHHRWKRRSRNCNWCGMLFSDIPAKMKQRRFCCRICAVSATAAAKKPIKDSYSYHHRISARTIRLQPGIKKCSECSNETNLLVHHKDGNHANNGLQNLEVLCRSCHSRLHIVKRKR